MYTDAPQEFLTTRGLLFKKEEEKKDHDMQIQDVKLIAEIEEKQWKSCCFSLHQECSLFFAVSSISSRDYSLLLPTHLSERLQLPESLF
jgi:hypothetical protein